MDKNTDFYLHINDKEVGPVKFNQLIESGLTPDALVWWQGASNWTKAADLPELRPLLASRQPAPQQPQPAPQPAPQPQPQQPVSPPAQGCEATVPCPYCGEPIVASSTQCPYCGSWLQNPAAAPQAATEFVRPQQPQYPSAPSMPPSAPQPGAMPYGAPAPPAAALPAKKSNTGLIVGIVVAVLLLIGGGVAAYFMLQDNHRARHHYADDESDTEMVDETSSPSAEEEPVEEVRSAAERLATMNLNEYNVDEYVNTFIEVCDEFEAAIRAHDQDEMRSLAAGLSDAIDVINQQTELLSEAQQLRLGNKLQSVIDVARQEGVDLDNL